MRHTWLLLAFVLALAMRVFLMFLVELSSDAVLCRAEGKSFHIPGLLEFVSSLLELGDVVRSVRPCHVFQFVGVW